MLGWICWRSRREIQEAGVPPRPNLDDLLGLELIEKYESPYLPVFTLGLRHVEVELSS